VLQLQLDKAHLLTLYTPDARLVLDKQTEIDAQEQRLAEARNNQWVPDSEITALNDRRKDLEMQYLAANLAAGKDRLRLEGASILSKEMHDRVRELGVADVERQALLRDVQAGRGGHPPYRQQARGGPGARALH